MPSLTIAWEYLTGYAVATDPSTRDQAEWPPHPARVFMALAAALFETEPPAGHDNDRQAWDAEKEALRRLETLGDPEILLPDVDRQAERSNVTVYVPVNDRPGPAAATLQSCPAITRNKQPRSFPSRWVGNQRCLLRWSNAPDVETYRDALARLCRKVTRVGHSSSLVAMHVADPGEEPPEPRVRLVPEPLQSEFQTRAVTKGTLEMLEERFGTEPRSRYAKLTEELDDLKSRRKTLTGKGAKEQKTELAQKIQQRETELAEVDPRPPVRPVMGLWTGYRRAEPQATSASHGLFDTDILILSHESGPPLPLASTLAVTQALRGAIMSRGPQPVPDWVSGHSAEGQPLRSEDGHLAIIPLPFVGTEYADGHLMGVALVFPRSVSYKERGRVLGPLLIDDWGQPQAVHLKLVRGGEWTVRKSDWQERRSTLQPNRWTAFGDDPDAPKGATIWASVTPVVLDRFPKANRIDPAQRLAWEEEVRRTVGDSCVRIGLPMPEAIDIDTTSWHLGSPRAVAKRRPLRGLPESGANPDVQFGDGFPSYPAKGTNASRPQVHVWLQFPCPAVGPVILGAGRYQGYGLCKPLKGKRP